MLDNIWAVNIRGYNILLAKTHLTNTQLEYRKLHVAGFKGFNYKTTESQALRIFRPYGGMTCHFHQNLAFIAFKTADQMHSVCQLRLYTDDNRLLTGRPRVNRANDSPGSSPYTKYTLTSKAMSTQTSLLPDLSLGKVHSKTKPRHPRTQQSYQHPKQDSTSNQRRNVQDHTQVWTSHSLDDHPNTPTYDSPEKLPKNGAPNLPPHTVSIDESADSTSQLALILTKLNELDVIKSHLNALDTRINLLQPQPINTGMVAQRS